MFLSLLCRRLHLTSKDVSEKLHNYYFSNRRYKEPHDNVVFGNNCQIEYHVQ